MRLKSVLLDAGVKFSYLPLTKKTGQERVQAHMSELKEMLQKVNK